MKITTLSLLLFMFLFSCQNDDPFSQKSVVIQPLLNISDSINYEIFTDIEYLTLETTDTSLIGSIDKIMFHEGFYYILDKAQMKQIFIFSENGKFITTVGKIGGGPGEYNNIEDFTIDKATNNIVLLSYPSQVTVYSSDGQFIAQKKLTASALLWNISSYETGYICSSNHQSVLTGEEAFLIFNYDKDFKLQNKILQVLPTQIPIPPFISNPLLLNGDNISYFDVFTNSLHVNINKTHYESIRFNFDGKEVPLPVYANPQNFFMNQKKYSFFIDGIMAENLLIATFSHNGERYVSVTDVFSHITKTYKSYKWFPDKLLLFQNKTFFSYLNPSTILENKSVEFKKETNNYPLDINSNPVIIKFKCKGI